MDAAKYIVKIDTEPQFKGAKGMLAPLPLRSRHKDAYVGLLTLVAVREYKQPPVLRLNLYMKHEVVQGNSTFRNGSLMQILYGRATLRRDTPEAIQLQMREMLKQLVELRLGYPLRVQESERKTFKPK